MDTYIFKRPLISKRLLHILILLLSFHSSWADRTDSDLSSNDNVLKVGLPNVPGLMGRDEHNVPTGFPLEVTKMILEDEALDYVWIDGSWSELYQKILKGEIDILPGTQRTREREKILKFMDPGLYSIWSELYINKKTTFSSPTNLNGEKVGIVIDDNNANGFIKYIKNFDVNYIPIHYNSHEEAVIALEKNDIFALVGPKNERNHPLFSNLKSSGFFFNPAILTLSFPLNQDKELIDRFNRKITSYKNNADSNYYALYKKYNLTEYPTSQIIFPKWAIILLSGLFLITLIVVIFIFVLKDQIRIATQKLLTKDQQLKNALKIGEMGTWSYEIGDKTVYWSDELYALTGYSKDVINVTPQFLYSIIFPGDRKKFKNYLQNENALPASIDKIIRIKTRQGRYLFIRLLGVIHGNTSIKKRSMFGVVQNITAQKKYERALILTKEKAVESDKLKSAFLANISHEIRTPLNSIIGFSEIITRSDINQEKREMYAEIIKKQNHLLLQLIDDIIDQAKIESGTIKLKKENVSVLQIINELKEKYASFSSNKVDFKVNCQFEILKRTIVCDKVRLMQIVENFLSNAFKNTENGYVELSCMQLNKEIYFSVKDTGNGIKEKDLPIIFDRFHKKNVLKQGVGLGLTIAQSLSQQMNGKISVDSIPEKGSTFTFSFAPIIKE